MQLRTAVRLLCAGLPRLVTILQTMFCRFLPHLRQLQELRW
jgi:hypothetical protein